MIPLLSLIYWPPQALTVAILIGVAGGVQLIPQTVRRVRWREILPMVVAAGFAIPVGTWLLFLGGTEMARRGIGLVVLLSSLVLMTGWTYRGPRNVVTGAVAGSVSGVLNGFAGAGSVLPTLYFVAADEPAVVIRANIFFVVFLFICMTAVALAFSGTVTGETLVHAVALFVPYAATIWAGSRLFHRTADRTYRLAVLCLLAAIGGGVAFA
jgi:uncharacterized membrane protein YfcA